MVVWHPTTVLFLTLIPPKNHVIFLTNNLTIGGLLNMPYYYAYLGANQNGKRVLMNKHQRVLEPEWLYTRLG